MRRPGHGRKPHLAKIPIQVYILTSQQSAVRNLFWGRRRKPKLTLDERNGLLATVEAFL